MLENAKPVNNKQGETISCRFCSDLKGVVVWARAEGRECARCRSFRKWKFGPMEAAEAQAAKQDRCLSCCSFM